MNREATEPMADLQGKKVLFIAYFFPPVSGGGLPAAMRVIKFLRNLDNGEMHVLTTEEQSGGQNALGHMSLPVNGETIHRVKARDFFGFLLRFQKKVKDALKPNKSGSEQNDAKPSNIFKSQDAPDDKKGTAARVKDFIYNLFYFPDQAAPWILPAVFRGRKIVKKHDIDVIFATGSPWSSLIIGYFVSKLTGRPLVADFRDPWTNNPFHISKGKLLDRLAKVLERKVVVHAQKVTLNTDALLEEFLTVYSDLSHEKFAALPNGYDPLDYNVNLGAQEKPPIPFEKDANTIYLMHAGFLYGPRNPEVLLNAVREINKKLAHQDKKLCFLQVGSVKLAYNLREVYSDLITSGSLVTIPGMPYKDCLLLQSKMDVLVNIQPGTKTQVPSKFYDYLALKKPILSITDRTSALAKMVDDYSFGVVFDFEENSKIEGYLYNLVSSGELIKFEGYPEANKFEIKVLVNKLTEFL